MKLKNIFFNIINITIIAYAAQCVGSEHRQITESVNAFLCALEENSPSPTPKLPTFKLFLSSSNSDSTSDNKDLKTSSSLTTPWANTSFQSPNAVEIKKDVLSTSSFPNNSFPNSVSFTVEGENLLNTSSSSNKFPTNPVFFEMEGINDDLQEKKTIISPTHSTVALVAQTIRQTPK